MSNNNHRIRWIARGLAILFILFISMFALDVFEEDYAWWEILIALFMHLIPSFFLIAVTVIAWRWPKLGGIFFILLAVVSVIFFKTYEDFVVFLIVSVPPALVGGLFLWDGLTMKREWN